MSPAHPVAYTGGGRSQFASSPGRSSVIPMMRSPFSASATISRYRGSKMCSGRNTLGKSTTFGSGKSGSRSDMFDSMNRLRLLVHVVHEHVLAKRVRRGEIRLALADRGDAPHEAH